MSARDEVIVKEKDLRLMVGAITSIADIKGEQADTFVAEAVEKGHVPPGSAEALRRLFAKDPALAREIVAGRAKDEPAAADDEALYAEYSKFGGRGAA